MVGVLLHVYRNTETFSYCLLRLKLDVYLCYPEVRVNGGAAFSSCICKCHAVPLLHLGKSTEEKLRVQPLWLLWRRCATGYHDEVKTK